MPVVSCRQIRNSLLIEKLLAVSAAGVRSAFKEKP